MTNEELIAKIKAEIERQRKFIEGMFIEGDNNFYDGQDDAYNNILTFLSTLESENPVPKDLEEAAKEYEKRVIEETKCHHNALTYAEGYEDALLLIPDAFVTGAKWQKEQDNKELSDLLTIAHLQGAEQMKEQMLKGAVKWLVDDDYDELTEKGRFLLGSVGIGYNGYYIPYSDLLKLPKEDEQ